MPFRPPGFQGVIVSRVLCHVCPKITRQGNAKCFFPVFTTEFQIVNSRGFSRRQDRTYIGEIFLLFQFSSEVSCSRSTVKRIVI